MSKLFALLVGINDYHPDSDKNVTNLKGCVDDITKFEAFLASQFKADQRHVEILLNDQASYSNVLSGFQNHLAQATEEDIILFAYSGHGSREPAFTAFKEYFPEEMQETLVLYDSRIEGGFDLADKELAFLIEDLANTGADVVTIFDSCNSGGVTRDIGSFTLGKARQTSSRKTPRPENSFLSGYKKYGTDFLAKRFKEKDTALYLPNSPHIEISACRNTELAYELTIPSGVFSYNFRNVLEETGGNITYNNLFKKVRAKVSVQNEKQHPQFQTYGFFNGHGAFLGLGNPEKGGTFVVSFDKEDKAWQVEAGAINGLPTIANKNTTFDIYSGEQLVGKATTEVVGLKDSTLNFTDFNPKDGEIYDARLTSILDAPLAVGLAGDTDQDDQLKAAIEKFKPVHFEVDREAVNPKYSIVTEGDKLTLKRISDDAALRPLTGNDWNKKYQDIFRILEKIAQWEKIMDLDNPKSKIKKGDVELLFVEGTKDAEPLEHTGDEIILDATYDEAFEGFTSKPSKLVVRNNHPKNRHYISLAFMSSYYDYDILFKGWIEPNDTLIAYDVDEEGEPFQMILEDEDAETIDYFKLYVGNKEFDLSELQLNSGEDEDLKKLGEPDRFDLVDGMSTGTTRGMRSKGRNKKKLDKNDWTVIHKSVKTVKKELAIGSSEMKAGANGLITFKSHPSFKADVGLQSANSRSRAVEPMAVLDALANDAGMGLLQFEPNSRSIGAGIPNMIELTGIENEEALKDQPLEMEIAAGLAENETIIPLTFDGNHIIPVGDVDRLENGTAKISIDTLPAATENRSRSIGRALKLVFMKLVMGSDDIHQLRMADFSHAKMSYKKNIIDPIKKADNILLVVHGIIGNTKAMAESVRPLIEEKKVDLVLTYDYENLNTPINEIAEALKKKLDDAGIRKDTGKKITIMAHSMGGLVSRYFIEELGGDELVSHLVMAGTPNAGSNIAKITTYRDYAIPLLTLLVNQPFGIAAAATVLGVMKKSKQITKTLEMMDPGSDFLTKLNKSSKPGVPYSIVAGYLDRYLHNVDDKKTLIDKAYNLGGKLFFGDTSNDIAVAVESIKTTPVGLEADEIVDVDCHHLNYFQEVPKVLHRLVTKKV